jgi:hypothetical protein
MDQTHFSLFSREKLTRMRERERERQRERERDVSKKILLDRQDLLKTHDSLVIGLEEQFEENLYSFNKHSRDRVDHQNLYSAQPTSSFRRKFYACYLRSTASVAD